MIMEAFFKKKIFSEGFLREFFGAFAASSVLVSCGTVVGWTSPAIPSMKQDQLFQDHFTDIEYSWIGSCLCLGFILSSLLTPLILPSLGPKHTLLICCLPCFALSFSLLLVTAFYPSMWIFYLSRILGGFAFVTANTTVPSYILDITSPSNRGLAILVNLFYRVGLVLVYVVGSLVSWWWTSLFNLCLVLPSFLLLLFVPDSPTSLSNKGKYKIASIAIGWLKMTRMLLLQKESDKKCEKNPPQQEIVTIEDGHSKKDNESNKKILRKHSSVLQALSKFRLPENYLPTLLSFCLCISYFMGGVGPLLFYTFQFFQDAGTTINASLSSIIVALINLLTVIIVSVGFSNSPRRLMILIGQGGTVVCLFTMALYFYLKDLNEADNIKWLPLLILCSFFIFFNIGLSSFMWTIIAEILPTTIRSFAYPASMFIGSLFFFLSSFFFHSLFIRLGGSGVFLVHAIPSLLLFVIFYFCLPETKGKTKTEVENFFLRK